MSFQNGTKKYKGMKKMAEEYDGPHKIILNRNEHNMGISQHMSKCYIELANGEIIIAAHGDDISLPNRTSKEVDFLLNNPDYFFLSDPQAFTLVTSPNSPWRHLNAVKNKHVYLVPKNLYGWIADPPSINRLLGIYYVAGIMYPEIAKVNIREEAKKYYKLFYNYNLKDSEIKL